MLTIQRLSVDEAQSMIEAAVAKAQEIGVPMCIAVADEGGHLIVFRRMDGAKVGSVQIAIDKAFTAAVSRKPTHVYNEIAVPGSLTFGINTSHGGRFCTVGGGFPVEVGGQVVGAIGVSAGTPQQDMLCAEAGLSALAG